MAVPKKKRIGYRITNKGSQFRGWHLLMLNLTLSTAPLSHLKRLVSISKASINKRTEPASILQPLPKFKLRLLPIKKTPRPFDKEALPLSAGSLTPQSGRKPLWGFSSLTVGCNLALRASLIWRLPTRGSAMWQVSNMAPTLPPVAMGLQHLKLVLKRFLFTMQIPHKWGRQRAGLLRRWELSPSYFYLPFLMAPLGLPQGFLNLNRPTNLSAPHGPTLNELLTYIKTNPNDGYWAYCMWLQLKKKWKRWLSFPHQYFAKRNVWQRAYQRKTFYESLDGHRVSFLRPSRVAVFSSLKAMLFLKSKLKRAPFSMLTNFALLLNSFVPLTPKGVSRDQVKLRALASSPKPKRLKNKTLTLFRGARSTFRSWFKSPI